MRPRFAGPVGGLIAALVLAAGVGGAHAQQSSELLAGIRSGGGWVSVPIHSGAGAFSTTRLPSMGMTLIGCVHVWPGHSGDWRIHAREAIADTSLVIAARPGEGVPFEHTFGMQAQLDFDFRWSEPRDTTLMMWVGLAIGRTAEESCEPVYPEGR